MTAEALLAGFADATSGGLAPHEVARIRLRELGTQLHRDAVLNEAASFELEESLRHGWTGDSASLLPRGEGGRAAAG